MTNLFSLPDATVLIYCFSSSSFGVMLMHFVELDGVEGYYVQCVQYPRVEKNT